MNKNYMIFPMKYMRVTQGYLGNTSHLKHTTGYPKDYPIDCAGKDTGRDAVYCPCDEMIVTAIKGVGNGATNTVWLVSTSKVVTPTFEDICFMTLTHSNDSDFKNMKVGDKFLRGDILCYEGTDGATSNHIHIVVGQGSSKNWEKNTTGAWVISGNTKKPEEVFYVDPEFTTVLSSGGLSFQTLNRFVGTPITRDYQLDQLEIVVDNLRARNSPSLSSTILGYARRGVYTILEEKIVSNNTWYHIDDFWIFYNSSWIHLFPKQQEEIPKEIDSSIKQDDSKPEENHVDSSKEVKLIFTAPSSKYYKIFLKENAKLYLKEF